MMLKLYNTPDRRQEEFAPLRDNDVALYTCGPTVYNYLHVGNWVAYIRWDILVRTLALDGYDVTRVMNITDVGHLVSDADEGEDKILKGARREGLSMYDIAQRYTDDFMDGMKKLNLLLPTFMTRATDFIPEQIALIQRLEAGGYTYVIDDGVYFDTAKFPRYGDFAHLDIEGLKAGARVSVVSGKRNPTDFALWKFDRDNQRTEMVWDSPWGKGFPGWHLECSAMAMAKLGETIDIHTGGIDHIPVHHTNEIAQSEAATGKTFARYWMHANFLTVDGTKISKSLNNGFTLQDIAAKGFSPTDFKMFVLQSHYRTESNFTWGNLEAAKNRLTKWRAFADLRYQDVVLSEGFSNDNFMEARRKILEALNDDLETPVALAIVDEVVGAIQTDYKISDINGLNAFVNFLDEALGLGLGEGSDISDAQKALIDQRVTARRNKDWTESDALRDRLLADGIAVNDTPIGQIWSRL